MIDQVQLKIRRNLRRRELLLTLPNLRKKNL